jgi:hypothetical protein
MKHLLRATAVAFLAIPVAAPAQEFGGAVTLGFGTTDISDIPQDIGSRSLAFSGGVDFGNGLALSGDLGIGTLDIDDVPFDISARIMGLDADYRFGGGFRIGAYAERATLSIDGLPVDPDLDSYGIKAGYATPTMDVGLFLGRSSTDPDLPGIDIEDRGLTFAAQFDPGLRLGGYLMETELSDGIDDLSIRALGLAGSYRFADSWMAFAGYTRSSIEDLDGNLSTFGLGAGYDLSSVIDFGAVVSLELARTTLTAGGTDVGDLDTVRFGFTIPLGQGSAQPLNSVANSVFDPRRSAVTATALSAF